MRKANHNAVLADAAAGLSQQLLDHLKWMSEELAPHVAALDKAYFKRLKHLKYDRQQCESLAAITIGAAARILSSGASLSDFLEQVQYRGKRLAKLGLTPASVVSALREYNELLEARFGRMGKDHAANLSWVRNQLDFLSIVSLNSAFYHVREAESHTFYELFRVEVESRTLEEMLPRLLSVLVTYTGADDGRIYLLDGDGRGWAPHSEPASAELRPTEEVAPKVRNALAKPRLLDLTGEGVEMVLDVSWRKSFKTCWSIPLRAEGKLRGVMQFAFRKQYALLPREEELLLAAAERCWLAAEKARLLDDLGRREEQVRRLAEHMVEVEESERRRISRELHDEAGQSLLCIRLQMEILEQELPPDFEPWRKKLGEVRELTEHTIVEIRRLIAALSPAILEQIGLAAALRQLIGRFRRLHPADVRLQLPRRLEMPKKMEIIVYRLVQEIFNNIAKYSLASDVNLSVYSVDGCLRLHVEDNGIGFNVQEALSRRDCFGLSGLRERVALLGGTLVVQSLPKATDLQSAGKRGTGRRGASKPAGRIGVDRHGTSISIQLPLPTRGQATPGVLRGAAKHIDESSPSQQ